MSFQNEEGTPLMEEKIVVNDSNKIAKPVAILSLTLLALAGIVCYVSGYASSTQVQFTDLSSHNKLKQLKHLSPHEHMLKTVVSNDFAPYSYLSGKFLTYKYPTVGHGLDQNGEIDKKHKPFYSLDIKFFQQVSKTHYNKNENTLETKNLLGSFKGLDDEGNLVFTDGGYCEVEQGPSYGKVEVLCGNNFAIAAVKQVTECNIKVIVTHPHQCQDPVKTVAPTDGSAAI